MMADIFKFTIIAFFPPIVLLFRQVAMQTEFKLSNYIPKWLGLPIVLFSILVRIFYSFLW